MAGRDISLGHEYKLSETSSERLPISEGKDFRFLHSLTYNEMSLFRLHTQDGNTSHVPANASDRSFVRLPILSGNDGSQLQPFKLRETNSERFPMLSGKDISLVHPVRSR